MPAANGSTTPFLENDAVITQMNQQFGGNYLNEETILAAARAKGYSTAAIGKVGPVHIFDPTEITGVTINVDDATGSATGLPLTAEIQAALTAAGRPLVTPSRGPNGVSGTATTPGTEVANTFQQQYFASVAAEVVLPLFAQRSKPFVMVFWSRDPDGTQHNQGDSLLSLTPGINGPTSVAAVRNADNDLQQLFVALHQLGLDQTTDVILTSDHGFSTISKQSSTSQAVQHSYTGVPAGLLPRGFVAIDLAIGLGRNCSIQTRSRPYRSRPRLHHQWQCGYRRRSNRPAGRGGGEWRVRPDLCVAGRHRHAQSRCRHPERPGLYQRAVR